MFKSVTVSGSLLLATAPSLALGQNVNPYPFPIAQSGTGCLEGVSAGIFNPDGSLGDTVRPPDSLKCGIGAVANAPGATAVGDDAVADGANATAIGRQAWARAAGATALGANATASFSGSTAIGAGAATTAANQVALGAAGTSVRVGDIAASTAAQKGPVAVATVDAFGTLGRDTTVVPAIQALQAAGSAQAGQISSLQAVQSQLQDRVGTLFDLRQGDRRDTQQGIAAAVAMGQAPMPSAAGRTSYVFNLATFRGEQAIGGSLMHRLEGDRPFAISAGFSYSGQHNNAARVGVAGEF